MAIKEEQRGEFAETNVDNGINNTDVNVRTGMTNSDFDLFQKKEVNGEQEFRDDLYEAIKKGDVERVKELTGWTRDATRPDNAVVPELAQQTQENANKKEEDDKRLQNQQLANTQMMNEDGKPVDPLMAFLTDPFGLHGDTTKPAQSYNGNSLEEAIRNGDWSAAARIMNALLAREQNEGQDFTGDGYVAGAGADAGLYGPGYSEDAYGNWTYNDPYGGQYNQFGYAAADGSFTSLSGMTVSPEGNITLSNGQAYTSFTGEPITKADAVGIASASTTILEIQNGIDPTTQKPDPTKVNDPPPGSAQTSLAKLDTHPKETAILSEDVNIEAKQRYGRTFDKVMDPVKARALATTRNEVMAAVIKKYGHDDQAIETAFKTLRGKDDKAREALYTDLLGDKYKNDPQKYNSMHLGGAIHDNKLETLQKGKTPAPAAPTTATATTTEDGGNIVPQAGAKTGTDPTSAYAWAEDEWFYDDASGQMGGGYKDDTLGYYWEPDGGHYDQWGYTDKDGGYTWDASKDGPMAGAYQDVTGNFIDKQGNLFLASNTTDKPDRLAAEAPDGGSWKDILQKDASSGTTFTLPAKTDAVATQPAINTTQPAVTSTQPAATTLTAATTQTAPVASMTTATPTGTADSTVPAAKTGAGSLYSDASTEATVNNFSQFMGSLTSFLSASEVTRAVNAFAPSSFIDLSSPITAGSSTVWGTKFFDPAAITSGASAVSNDATPTIAPTNPYYKPAAQAAVM